MKQTVFIGGVCVEICSGTSTAEGCVATHTSVLERFPSPTRCLSTVRIDILDDPPTLGDRSLHYRDGELSGILREADCYWLGLRRPGIDNSELIARSDLATTRVEIFAGQGREYWSSSTGIFDPVLGTPFLRLLLTNHLASRGGIIVHAAGVAVEDQGFVFPGVSTAGKSTLMRCFRDAGMSDAILSDERIVVRSQAADGGSEGKFEAWGTPWVSDTEIVRNAGAPLAGLFFLVKAKECGLNALQPNEAMPRLMRAASYPWYDEELGQKVLDMCGRLAEEVPCFDLHFTPDEDVVKLLRDYARGR